MNLTQVAGSQIGVMNLYDDTGRAKPSSPIVLIVDPQTHSILDYITTKNIIRDNHKKSLEDTLETFTMTTFADKRFSQHLEKRNRIIIPDEDNNLVEFVPFEIVKYRDSEGHKIQVYSHASYLEIKKAGIINPDTYEGTATQHLGRALNNTGWRIGKVESGGSRSIAFDNHTNPFAYIKRIARELDLEPNFRIEPDGAKITGRDVDLLERVGAWRNRTVEFGKDLQGIRRVEKQDIYTALLGVMPEDEEGNQRTVLVEDEEALQRWGRIDEHGELQHLIGTHEIQSTRSDMTEEEARQYTRTELDKRINTTVTYEANIVDLEHVPGMRNKKIRHGDTIRIKDTKFNPPLYLEARVFESDGSIKERGNKQIKLGDFVEFTQEEVDDIWRSLREQIRKRITAAELAEYTYNKIVIDNKDEAVRTDVESYANTVSSEAKDEAIIYTNNTIDPIVVTVDDIEVDLDDVKSDVSDTISQISQLSDRVSVVVAENGTINAETIASELAVTPSAIDLISDNITLSANQINFDGHVFGSDATFTGTVEGSNILGSTFISSRPNPASGGNLITNLSVDGLNIRTTLSQSGGTYSSVTYDHSGLQHQDLSSPYQFTSLEGFNFNAPLTLNGNNVDSIVSQGANADGHWIRYANGIQICWAQPFGLASENAVGALYRSDPKYWSYPQAFVGDPSVSVSISSATRWADISGSPSSSSVGIRSFSYLQGDNEQDVYVQAIGRWK